MILDTLMIFLFHMCETSVEHIEILYLFKTLNGSAVLAALGGLASEAELLTSWSSGSTSLPFFPVLSFPLADEKLSQVNLIHLQLHSAQRDLENGKCNDHLFVSSFLVDNCRSSSGMFIAKVKLFLKNQKHLECLAHRLYGQRGETLET